jgi:DNA polymerase I-like protein with 3'-5' exonuclease and polymerase domains
LRILAHITGDEPLVEAFRNGQDVHIRTAADLFDVEVSQVDAEMRRKAKMTNYAIAYGVSGFGLAKQLGTGKRRAKLPSSSSVTLKRCPASRIISTTLCAWRARTAMSRL